MYFDEIKPFIRYARYQTLEPGSNHGKCMAYDARLFYALSGNWKINIENQSFEMTSGSCVFINSQTDYELKASDISAPYIALNFDFTQKNKNINIPVGPDFPWQFKVENTIEHIIFEDEPRFEKYIYLKNIKTIEKLLKLIVKEYTDNEYKCNLKASCLMVEIMVEMLRKEKLGTNSKINSFSVIIDYIHNNYIKNPTNKEIADFFGFHPNYISRIIKEHTGMPMHQYIIRLKLNDAVKYLETGSYSIGEVAEKCGFYDIYHFSKYFKSVMNVSPSEFIKKV